MKRDFHGLRKLEILRDKCFDTWQVPSNECIEFWIQTRCSSRNILACSILYDAKLKNSPYKFNIKKNYSKFFCCQMSTQCPILRTLTTNYSVYWNNDQLILKSIISCCWNFYQINHNNKKRKVLELTIEINKRWSGHLLITHH